jgi:hypothetical protein
MAAPDNTTDAALPQANVYYRAIGCAAGWYYRIGKGEPCGPYLDQISAGKAARAAIIALADDADRGGPAGPMRVSGAKYRRSDEPHRDAGWPNPADDALVGHNTLSVASLDQLMAAICAHTPTRDERMQLAKMQAELGLAALAAGDLRTTHVFLVDALYQLNEAEKASR